jgi:hypothetical protein
MGKSYAVSAAIFSPRGFMARMASVVILKLISKSGGQSDDFHPVQFYSPCPAALGQK